MHQARLSRFSRVAILIAVLVSVLPFIGCILVPHPMTSKNVNMVGDSKPINVGFIRAGVTTLAEVQEKLADFDSGYKHERLFWGRWSNSKKGLTFAVGGPGAATGGTSRFWGAHNIFVCFDDKGVVTSWHEFKDGDLAQEATAWVKENNPPPVNLDKELRLLVSHHHALNFKPAVLTLSKESIAFADVEPGSHSFVLAPSKVRFIGSSTSREREADPHMTDQSIHLSQNTAAGSKITVEMLATDFMTLVIYLRDSKTKAADTKPAAQ